MTDHSPQIEVSQLTPLDVVECLVAPAGEIGPLIGLHASTAFLWRHATKHRAAGDIPTTRARDILLYARKHNLPLTAEHLIMGGKGRDIADLCEQIGKPFPAHLRDRLVASGKVAAE